ncbi:hypothetical protein YC2023_085164 [Brassica napus]
MVLSYSQAGETGLGTDKEREEKEEKEDIFHYLIISKLARTNGKMVFHQNLFFFLLWNHWILINSFQLIVYRAVPLLIKD